MGNGDPDSQRAFRILVDRCQTLAAGLGVRDFAPDALQEVKRLASDLAPAFDCVTAGLLWMLLVQTVAQLVQQVRSEQDFETTSLFVSLTTAPPNSWRFQKTFSQLVDSLCQRSSVPPLDPRVSLAVEIIATRYADSRLRLTTIAKELNLSPTHLSRLLTRHTGRGFAAHMRERRIAAASDLLRRSVLSVKQVRVAVGYTSTALLDRHFKATYGTTPSSFRRH